VAITVAGAAPIVIPVQLTVSTMPLPLVSPNPPLLTITAAAGSGPIDIPLTLQANSIGAKTYRIATETGAAHNWLSVSPAAGTITGESTVLSVTADPSGLAPGTYAGRVIVSVSAGREAESVVSVPVTFFVIPMPQPASGTVTPVSLSFTVQPGTSETPAQILTIFAPFSVSPLVQVTPSHPWLIAGPVTQSGNGVVLVPVRVGAGTLANGSYQGVLTVTIPGVPPITVPVSLAVGVEGPPARLSQSALTFITAQGEIPVPRGITLVGRDNRPLAVTAKSDSDWLEVDASVEGASLVSINSAHLGPGDYAGSITYTLASGEVVLLPVLLTVR
jgi:hypothetical protein